MSFYAHVEPLGTVVLSVCLGMASWLANPDLWRAGLVAFVCGVLGGVGRVAGQRIYCCLEKRKGRKKAGK